MNNIEKELKGCTFYPTQTLKKSESIPHNFNDFFKRNAEWQKKKEADIQKTEEEAYSFLVLTTI